MQAIQRARPVRRSILEPCRQVQPEGAPAAAAPAAAAGGAAASAADAGAAGMAGDEDDDLAAQLTWGGGGDSAAAAAAAAADDGAQGPRRVLAMAAPIAVGNARRLDDPKVDGGEAEEEELDQSANVTAVLLVWDRRNPDGSAASEGYGTADEQTLRTLAAIAGHLLLQDEEVTRLQRAHNEATQHDASRRTQMSAIVHAVRQPGASDTTSLHAAAHALAAALGCEWCLLWLVEHVAGIKQRVATEHRNDEVLLPADLPASGRGLIGLALTTGRTVAVPDALIAPQYSSDVDGAAAALPDATTAMAVVPLRDHFGQVLGALQAGGKRPPMPRGGADAAADALQGWRPSTESPAFTSEDVDFLEIMAAKLAASLQALLARTPRLRPARTSSAPHPHLIRTSSAPHPHLIRTSSLQVLMSSDRGAEEVVDLQTTVSELQGMVISPDLA